MYSCIHVFMYSSFLSRTDTPWIDLNLNFWIADLNVVKGTFRYQCPLPPASWQTRSGVLPEKLPPGPHSQRTPHGC
jgi:hypothetical protein